MDNVVQLSNGPERNIFMPCAVEIVHVEQITPSEKHFTLKPEDENILNYRPGQMLEVSLFGYGEITIGYASSPTRKITFDIVVRAVGRVSNAIHKLSKGDTLYVRGPLGNGFNLDAFYGHDMLIIAGGIGLCPNRSLIHYILDRRDRFGKFTLFFGARSPGEQLFLEDLDRWRKSDDVDFFETVDNPDADWRGNVGVITELFKITDISPHAKAVVCGPPVMYPYVIAELKKTGISDDSIFLDLERRMKCGIGKCGHCQINDLYCCIDGPVFSYDKIKDLEEAF